MPRVSILLCTTLIETTPIIVVHSKIDTLGIQTPYDWPAHSPQFHVPRQRGGASCLTYGHSTWTRLVPSVFLRSTSISLPFTVTRCLPKNARNVTLPSAPAVPVQRVHHCFMTRSR